MADRPILFSAPMVRALLAGTKTQTRRIIMPQPHECVTGAGVITRSGEGQTDEWSWLSGDLSDLDGWSFEGDFKTRFIPGDRLWVREAWRTESAFDKLKPSEVPSDRLAMEYLADDVRLYSGRYRHARFMPRWASRVTLPVVDVRVEQLQDISEADAIAEGLSALSKDGTLYKYGIPDRDGLPGNDDCGWHWQDWHADPVAAYKRLWGHHQRPRLMECEPLGRRYQL